MTCTNCGAIVPLRSVRCQESDCQVTSVERLMTTPPDDATMDTKAFDIYLQEG